MKISKKQKIQKEEEEPMEEEPRTRMTKQERREMMKKERKKKMQEEDDEDLLEESEEEEDRELTPGSDSLQMSGIEEKEAQKEKHYKDSLTQIAVNCEQILEDPNKGISRHRNEISPMNAVLILIKDPDSRIQQVAMLSLMKVFNDVLPVDFMMFCHS